jgi:virulence factor
VCFIEAEHEGKGVLYADGDTAGTEYDTREVAGSDENYAYGGFQAKSRDFIDAVQTGGLPGSHFGDAIKTMEVAEKILATAVLGG